MISYKLNTHINSTLYENQSAFIFPKKSLIKEKYYKRLYQFLN